MWWVFTRTLVVAVVYGSIMMFWEVDQLVTEILVAGELTYMQQQELVDIKYTLSKKAKLSLRKPLERNEKANVQARKEACVIV